VLRESASVPDADGGAANGPFDLGIAEQDLHGAAIARPLADDRSLGSPNAFRCPPGELFQKVKCSR
jgi:hypothetical protein